MEDYVKVSDYNLNYFRAPTFSHVIQHVFGGGLWLKIIQNNIRFVTFRTFAMTPKLRDKIHDKLPHGIGIRKY